MRKLIRFRPPLALLSLAPFAIPLAALGGCQSAPIDPPALADRAALSAREVVHQTGGGVAFTQGDDSGLQKMLTGVGHASDGLGGMAAALPPGMMSAMGGTAMAQAAAGMPSLQTTEEQFDDTADDLKVWLRERILADANLESQTSDEAVYLLHGKPTCLSLPRAGDPADVAPPTLSQRCVDQLGRVQVRVVLRADGDGVRLTIEVGPDKLELSAIIIHSDLLAIESNLPRTQAATKYIDQTLGSDSPMGGDELETLTGVVRVSLQKLADKKVTFAISVPSAIHVATRSASGTPGPDVQVAASASTFALTADGVAQTATASVNLGAVDVLTDWHPQGSAAPNRDLHVAVGGLTGATTFTEGVEALTSKGLGIGATSLAVRGANIFNLDLNPSDLHRFDLVVTIDDAGEPHFAVTPRFDLSLGFHLNAVAGDFARENQPPASLLNETYRIRLDNGGAAATIASVPASGTFGGGLSVGPGTLTLSSDKVAAPIVVPAGKCLTHVDNPPADAHPILGAFAVADCK